MMRVNRLHVPPTSRELALCLLHMRLIRTFPDGTRVGGRIIEVESYPPNDESSHCFRGERPRCKPMFARHWSSYVYVIYGTSYCLNIVSEAAGIGAAVLIRALEPEFGLERMMQLRKTTRPLDLVRGPGRLCQALGIDLSLNNGDLDCMPELALTYAGAPDGVVCGPRIGLTKNVHAAERYYAPANPFVSGAKRFNAAGAPLAAEELARIDALMDVHKAAHPL